MAETLISPGVLARENDQSQITSQPIQAGAAIVGPTVIGCVGIPKLVTSYSEYLANYGSTFQSGSDEYTFFTSISAYNYFQNGGTSLLVTRVASGSFAPASSSLIPALESESTTLEAGRNISGSTMTMTGFEGVGGTAAVATSASPSSGRSGLTLNLTTGVKSGKLLTVADALLAEFQAGSNPSDLGEGSYSAVPITQGSNVSGQATVTVNASSQISAIEVTTAGAGYIAGAAEIAAGALGTGQLVNAQNITAQSALLGGTTLGNVTGPFTFSKGTGGYAVTGGSQQTGDLATITVTGDGAGALSSVVVANQGTNFVAGNVLTILAADLVTAGFTACDQNLVITLVASNVQNSSAATATLAAADFLVEAEDAIVVNGGTGYEVGDIITVLGSALGGSGGAAPANNVTFTLTHQDLVDTNVFTLETLSEGEIMNSAGTEASNGALENGTAQNVRWEIQAPNSGSGVFSLVIRQGNDNSKSKSILEVFPNVSLDPKQSNYISRIVGDMTMTLKDATTSEPYLQSTGSYRNASRYVRVSSVNLKTPDYFDNSGIAKAEFTGSLPEASSGSFGGAEGSNISGSSPAKYYQYITDDNSQGLTSTEMGNVKGGYGTAFNLLANKDDYRFNILSAPGLYKASSTYSTPLNVALSTVQSRGDAILLMDLVAYNSSLTTVTSQASSVDNSYAASYWPWVQINDPDAAQLAWCPASALIPGVYAYNDKAAEAWFAPAGINRGGLSTVVQAERKLTQTNRDDLYTGKVNPIATFPGRGVVVFGQKTLQSQASALDRVNVRRLLIELKSYISQIADNLVFEQNTAATRNSFLAQVNPYLASVQQRQGLYAFKVVMDASNNGPDVIDRNQMVGAIYLQPTKTAEFIYLDFNILPTGAEFPS